MTEHQAYLSLGSNIDASSHLRSALLALRKRFQSVELSPVYRTKAIGFDGDDFYNLAARIGTDLDAEALNDWLHDLELQHGRDRSLPRFSSRPLDIDVVFFDDLVISGPNNLQIPRPELQHAFVLKPLFDLDATYVVPNTGQTLSDLWAAHPENRDAAWHSPLPADWMGDQS